MLNSYEWIKKAVDLILAGITSLFVLLRMRGDGAITSTEQVCFQLVVAVILLNECRVKINDIVNGWHMADMAP